MPAARPTSALLRLLPLLLLAGCTELVSDHTVGVPVRQVTEVFTGSLNPGAGRDYLVRGMKGTKFRILLDGPAGSAADSVHVAVLGAASLFTLVETGAAGGMPAGMLRASSWQIFPSDAPYIIRVRSAAGAGGAYRFQLQTARRAIAIGDTVTGTILPRSSDPDSDLFDLVIDTVSHFVVLLKTPPTGFSNRLTMTGPQMSAISSQPNSAIGRGSPRIRLDPGAYQFLLTGEPLSAVPYWIHFYPIDLLPEGAPAALAAGDVIRESIDPAGDVDEFTFRPTADGEVNVLLRLLEGMSAGLRAHIVGPDGTVQLGPISRADTLVATGRMTVRAGAEYTVRMFGSGFGAPGVETGRYELELYPVDRRPESVPQRITAGELITGESIDRPGDVDEFLFHAEAGSEFFARLAVAAGPIRFNLRILDPNGAHVAGGSSVFDEAWRTTPNFVIQTSGDHRIIVEDAIPLRSTLAGPYTLLLQQVDRRPESIGALVTPGEWVTGESIDYDGDIDEFSFEAVEGVEYIVFAHHLPGGSGLRLSRHGASEQLFSAACNAPLTCWNGVFRAPASGPQMLRFRGGSGPYAFMVRRIDPAPEVLPASVQIPVTLTGETIDPIGDIDRFTFHRVAGQVTVTWAERFHGLTFTIENVRTGALVPTGPWWFLPDAYVYLPSDDEYRISFFASGTNSPNSSGTPATPVTGPYAVILGEPFCGPVQPLPRDTVLQGTIQFGECGTTFTHHHEWDLVVEEPTTLSLSIRSHHFEPVLRIRNADWSVHATVSPGLSQTETLERSLQPGNYRVHLEAGYGSRRWGDYVLEIRTGTD